jgi:demethoxyubiquinone hydroxylase (CLK1/Coq7/Cat5 family)
VSIESFLAKLYSDADARGAFLAAPEATARDAGLADADVLALCRIDRAGLLMAAKSYAGKRAAHRRPKLRLADLLPDWMRRSSHR